jgi:MscS family membrane protein
MRADRLTKHILTFAILLGTAATAGAQFESLVLPTGTGDEIKSTEDQTDPAAPAPVPESLSNARATITRFLQQTNHSDYAGAAECLDLSDMKVTSSDAEKLAYRLKFVLDRLGRVDLQSISDDPKGLPYRFPPNSQSSPIGIEGQPDGKWLFTSWTVAQIDDLYERLKDTPPVAGLDWIQDLFPAAFLRPGLLLPHYQWICIMVVIFLGMSVDRLVRLVLSRMTMAWLKLAKIEIDKETERNVWKPVGLLAMALVWYSGTKVIGLQPEVLSVLLVAVKFFAVVSAVWTAFQLINLLSSYLLKKSQLTATKFDDLLIPLVSRTLKVFSVCVGVVLFAEMFNLKVYGLLSGLGLGGLAIALAAKDTLGNIFGSLTVLMDRPFEIGDWIITGDIEGTVESVGIRSSRVRTFYNSLITVPNANLTTAVVDNMGRRRYRRIKTMLSLEYSTPPERIEAFCEGVRELLRRHPYTRKDYYHVYLNQFSASSLDVLLYCFIECPDWSVELRERERLFLDILKLAEELGVGFAFPTRTLHMLQQDVPSDRPSPTRLPDPSKAGRRAAAQIAGKPSPRQERPGPVEYLGSSEEDDASSE